MYKVLSFKPRHPGVVRIYAVDTKENHMFMDIREMPSSGKYVTLGSRFDVFTSLTFSTPLANFSITTDFSHNDTTNHVCIYKHDELEIGLPERLVDAWKGPRLVPPQSMCVGIRFS